MRVLKPCLTAALGTLLLVAPAQAQDQDAERERAFTVESDRVVLETKDGKLTVNGRTFERGDGPYVVRVETGDDGTSKVIVTTGGPGARFFGRHFEGRLDDEGVRVHRLLRDGDRRGFVVRRGDGEDDVEVFTFEGEAMGPGDDAEVTFRRAPMPPMEHLTALRETMPQALMLREHLANVEAMDAETHRALMEKEREAQRLAREARRAEGAERERLEQALRDHLEALFTDKLHAEREAVERHDRRLQERRERLQQREAARREVIERRMRELLGERDVLDW